MKKTWLVSLIVLIQLIVVPSVSADGGGRDRVIFGSSVVIDSEETVGDLVVFGGSVKILGRVGGDLVVFGGNARG